MSQMHFFTVFFDHVYPSFFVYPASFFLTHAHTVSHIGIFVCSFWQYDQSTLTVSAEFVCLCLFASSVDFESLCF